MNLIKFRKDHDLYNDAFGSIFNGPFFSGRDTASNFVFFSICDLLSNFYGEFSRSFNITKDIDSHKIDAEFKDGVLNITLPKVEEAKKVVKEISVK